MKLELDSFYIEYNIAYRTLTLYQKIKDRTFGEDKGFIIVAEDEVSEINKFFAENTSNSNFISIITALSKLFPLEGNFRKMISILNNNFKLNLIPPNQQFFKSVIEIKSEANKELYNAFRSGNIEEVKRLLEQYRNLNLQPDSGHVAPAIQSGNIEVVRFLEDFNLKPKNSSAFMYAIESKSLQMLEYLYKTYRNLYFTLRDRNDISWAAARTGDINILQFCVETLRLPIDTGTLYDAVSSKKIDLVKYLVEEKHVLDIDEALEHAQKENLTDISLYLESKRNITVNTLT